MVALAIPDAPERLDTSPRTAWKVLPQGEYGLHSINSPRPALRFDPYPSRLGHPRGPYALLDSSPSLFPCKLLGHVQRGAIPEGVERNER